MTNREAINLLEEVRVLDDSIYAYNKAYSDALEMALTALEAEEAWYVSHEYPHKEQWIPVTERLPKPYSGEYLVTINDGSVYTDILWFDSPGDGRYESCFYKTDDDGYGVVCNDVIAWMPLPSPFREGGES